MNVLIVPLVLIILALTILALLALAAMRRQSILVLPVTLSGLVLAALPIVFDRHVPLFIQQSLAHSDRFFAQFLGWADHSFTSRPFLLAILIITIAVVLAAAGYFKGQKEPHHEFYILLLLAVLGAVILVEANHFIALFLGLEILSVALYALIAYPACRAGQIEAAVKYLIMASVASAFLLFGLALLYYQTGHMRFAPEPWRPIYLAGLALILVGVCFKLALAPFHLWAADVYQGAPAPVAACIAALAKIAMALVLARLFLEIVRVIPRSYALIPHISNSFALIALASMLAGSLLALRQTNIKRLLAYSAITHMGFLLIGLSVRDSHFLYGLRAFLFYSVAYAVAAAGAFIALGALSTPEREMETIDAVRGLARSHPWLAAVFSLMLLSLIGMPPTGGFLGKFYLAMAAMQTNHWLLLAGLVIASVVSLVYYLRVLLAVYSATEHASELHNGKVALSTAVALGMLAIVVIGLGVVYIGWGW